MVKKLLKHEFIYYFRSFGMFLPIVLVIGAVARVFRFFDNGEVLSELAIGSSSLMLGVACVALMLLSTVACVVRFYKNMYSAEGYLTFTLPVTNAQHIFVKLLTAITCQAVCLLTVIAAVSIALSGDLFGRVLKGFTTVINELVAAVGVVNFTMFLLDSIVLLILSAAANMLLYYGCITVGQTAKKNRILMAVVAYFVLYIATQIISTVFTMAVMVLGMAGVLDGFVNWMESNMIEAVHLYLFFVNAVCGAMAVAFWLVTQKIMTKKLNLE